MRMFRRLTALCLTVLLLCTSAMAEAPFLRHASGWSLEQTPLEARLSASITAHMPYDDDRLAMLTDVTNNLSLRLTTGQDEGSVTVCVGQTEALTLAYLEDAVQLSCIPEVSFSAQEDAMGRLLGGSTTGLSLYGLRMDAETLLDDGWTLLAALGPALEEYSVRKSVKTNISDMGTARSCTDYTVPKADAEQLKETLLQLCPEGWLREIIDGLTFSGKQTLRVYRTADEVPLRMEYNGTCGPEGNLRTVKLVWRMRRDDTAHRDEVTLTSPAKSGGNKNTLEFERVIKENKSGAVTMEGSFTYTVTADRKTTARKGSFELTNAFTEAADVITGSVTLQQKLRGEDSFAGMTFTPDLTISGTEDEPVITGSLGVTGLDGKNVLENAEIFLNLTRCGESRWEARGENIDMDALTAEELALLQADVSAGVAAAIVRPLVILMGEDADWFFRDMSPEQIQRIIDAANNVVLE